MGPTFPHPPPLFLPPLRLKIFWASLFDFWFYCPSSTFKDFLGFSFDFWFYCPSSTFKDFLGFSCFALVDWLTTSDGPMSLFDGLALFLASLTSLWWVG